MTNRRMEEPVARGMVLRLDEQLRVVILAATVHPKHFFPRFPSFSVEGWSVFGGAGFLVNFSFDCYPIEAAERPGRRSRKLLVSGRERCRALFEFSNAIVEAVTTGYESLSPSCDGLTGPDDHGPMISRLIDHGALGNQAGQSVSSAGRSPHP
ncbi:hypothetical protein F511_20183 [Dorcoceras hygrometricum]|uniref:Uncharacterized protein n=1 Tax=Dorcoceras hygrometricum TaxID=472368 RepID=A0A2Z7BR87_9LAMI|nr:hypothetical protein F511_20183 [Dorcoceras hygrometricum]